MKALDLIARYGEVADEHDEHRGLGVPHGEPDRRVLLDERHDDAHEEHPDRRAGGAAEEGDDEGVRDRQRAHRRVDRVLQGVPEGRHAAADRAEEEHDHVRAVGVDADRAGEVGVDAGGLDPPAEAGEPQHRGEHQHDDDGARRLPHVEVDEDGAPRARTAVLRRARSTPASREPQSSRIRFSPAMPMPRAATNTASSAVGAGVGGERPVDAALDHRARRTAGEQHAEHRRRPERQVDRGTSNVNARYAASVYVNP